MSNSFFFGKPIMILYCCEETFKASSVYNQICVNMNDYN